MVRPKDETQDLLPSITKNCQRLIEQTHKKAEETLEFKMNKPKETCHFKPPIQINGEWIIELTDLEVYNSIFMIRKKNINFQLHTAPLDSEFSYTEMKHKIEELLDLSHITPEDLEHKTRGPDIIKTYRELSIEESQTDRYYFFINKLYTIIISRLRKLS